MVYVGSNPTGPTKIFNLEEKVSLIFIYNIKKILMKCECCGLIHDGSYGSGRFCREFCARKYSSVVNKKSKIEKLRNHFKGYK